MERNKGRGQRGPRKEGMGMVVLTWVATEGFLVRIDE